MIPRIIQLQKPIDLQQEVRRNYGIVEYPVFGLSNVIQPVLLTNIPDYPLNVNVVDQLSLVRIVSSEKFFTLGRNSTYETTTTLGAGATHTINSGLDIELKKGHYYRFHFGVAFQAQQSTAKPVSFKLEYGAPVRYLDLMYTLLRPRGTGTSSRFVFDQDQKHVDFYADQDYSTDTFVCELQNPDAANSDRLDQITFQVSVSSLDYNPP